MSNVRLIAASIVTLLVLLVVFQNTEPVETRFLAFTFVMPRAALLFGTLTVGFAAGVLFASRLMRHKDDRPKGTTDG